MEQRDASVGLPGEIQCKSQRLKRRGREIDRAEDALECRRIRDTRGGVRWHGQNRTGRLPQYRLSDRAEKQPREASPAVGSHHNQVCLRRDCLIDDRRLGIACLGDGSHAGQHAGKIQGAAHLPEHLFARHRRDDSNGIAEIASQVAPETARRLQEVRHVLDEIEEQLRRLSHGLRPTMLDDLGLLPALELLAEGVRKRAGLAVLVAGSTEGRLAPEVETTLYRICQEALTNVTKHARATQAEIRIQCDHVAVRCTIRDDGVGFDPASVWARRSSHGLGLIGMRERLTGVGGAFSITSRPRAGTTIEITVPVRA